MWQLSDSFSDEKNHKAVSHPAVLLMLIKLNYPLLALMAGCDLSPMKGDGSMAHGM